MAIRRQEVSSLESPVDIGKIPEAVLQIISRLDQAGYESWLVGGCVRDLCLGLVPKDYDLATAARPEDVRRLFEHSFATGLQHGTVTVLWQDLAVEITTFRSEGTYSDSRRPDLVVFHDEIEADLARRDFTMNSLAWRPDRGLLDLHGGLEDLRQGLLRTVGDACARFGEDTLRILRAVRFAVTYDLTPDPDLVSAAAARSENLGKLSRERIVGEILRILGSPYPQQLNSFAGCGILAVTAQLLLRVKADDHELCRHLGSLILPDLPAAARLPLLFLTASAPGLDVASVKRALQPLFGAAAGHLFQHLLMQECRLSRHLSQEGEAVLYLVWLRLLLPARQILPVSSQRRLLRLLARRQHLARDGLAGVAAQAGCLLRQVLGPEACVQPKAGCAFEFPAADAPPVTIADLALDGRQLHLAGWPSGPAMRGLLEKLLSAVINDAGMNRPADLLAEALAIAPPHPV